MKVKKSKPKHSLANKINRKSILDYGFGSERTGFFERNLFPYSFPLVLIGAVLLLLLIFSVYSLIFESNSIYAGGFFAVYFAGLVLFFLWGLIHCLIMGVLTNLIVLDGLMPFLKCNLEKLDFKKFLKLPRMVFILALTTMLVSGGIYFAGSIGVGLLEYANEISLVFAVMLFYVGVIKVARVLDASCKNAWKKYLLSLVFVLLNYLLIFTLFTVFVLLLLINLYLMTAL